jgi:hypothetical protein
MNDFKKYRCLIFRQQSICKLSYQTVTGVQSWQSSALRRPKKSSLLKLLPRPTRYDYFEVGLLAVKHFFQYINSVISN